MWLEPEAVGRDLCPDIVRAAVGMTMELDLEERPGDIHDDGAVSMAHRLPRVRSLPEPLSLPSWLIGVPSEGIGRALEEGGIVDGPLEKRRPRPYGSQVERVAALVEQV